MPSRRAVLISAASLGGLAALGYAAWPDLDAYRAEAARQRRPLAPEGGTAELARMASLAANGHNTQPWRFETRPGGVFLRPDLSRRTAVVDPDDHHLFVSLGCAAENLVQAAAAAGQRAEVEIRGGAAPGLDIALAPAPPAPSALSRAILHRQSTRAPFDGQPLPPEDLRRLHAAAQGEGVAADVFTAAPDREAILDFVVAGNSAQMADPAFLEELRAWIRFSPQEALARRDGLFAAASGAPAAPGWLARRLFDLVFTEQAENDKYREHIRSSAGVAVFVGEGEGPESWMRVGRAFQRFALQATALDIRTAHVNQPVEVPALRAEFAGWLGMPGRRPDLVVRFGRGPLMPMSLRRPPREIARPA